MLANGYYRVYVASSQGVLSAPAPNKLRISITRESGAPAEVSTCSVKNASSVSDSSTDFVMTIDTSLTSDDTVSLPLSGVYDVSVNWGDGSRERFVSGDNNEPCHSYSSEGTYTIRISGSLEHFGIDIDNQGPWRGVDIVNTVSNFGSLGIESFSGLFYGAENLAQVPTVLPVTVTNLSHMFYGAYVFDQDIGGWNVGNVTNMSGMFASASVFDQAIGGWDVGNVTDMSGMFYGASVFNHDIGGWDVGNVTNMSNMFAGASVFDQAIGGWDVGNVTDMSGMFYEASVFDQAIGDWDVGNVTNMSGMFYAASAFNHDIGDWDVGNVTNMSSMFYEAYVFNQAIGGWDVGNVTNMSSMFYAASVFNHDIGGWNVGNVTDMSGMFRGASVFNQAIGGW
jgi:surface protein